MANTSAARFHLTQDSQFLYRVSIEHNGRSRVVEAMGENKPKLLSLALSRLNVIRSAWREDMSDDSRAAVLSETFGP